MVLNEAEYEMYIDQKVKNLIQDETARIIDNRRPFVDWAYVYPILKEEIEETDEEIDLLKHSLDKYWNLVRNDAPNEAMVERLKIIALCAERTIHEAKQVGAVSLKAIEQLVNERNKKAPITDQSN